MTQNKQQVKDAVAYFEDMGFIQELTSDKKHFVQILINYVKENMDMDRDEVYDAKIILEKAGYDTGTLYNIRDITDNFHCSESMAAVILEEAYDNMEEDIWQHIVDLCNYYEKQQKD